MWLFLRADFGTETLFSYPKRFPHLVFRMEHGSTTASIVYLLHDPLGPLDCCRDHSVCPGAIAGVKQILGRFEVAGHQNPRDDADYPLAAFVHLRMIHVRFLFVYYARRTLTHA